MNIRKMAKTNTFSVTVIILIMIAVMCIFKHNYLSPNNVFALLKVLSVTTLVGISQMISISSGGMNVAIGATGALSAICSAWLMQNAGCPSYAAILAGLLVGTICGIINGLLIYRNGGVGVAGFLITLATASVFTGTTLMITKGRGISTIPDDFIKIGNSSVAGIPSSTIIMVIIVIIVFLLYKYVNLGRQILAFGANWKASQLYGVSKFKIVLLSNIIASIIAAIAGLLVVMRVGTAQPDIGNDWMLQSFAVPLIGGTRQDGGKVNVFGVILGGIVLTIITNALVHLKVDVYWNELINGIMILAIVALDRIRSIKE
jgi:ribose transport system permease protein